MTSSLPYRPGVGIMLLNRENKVFVGQRIDMRIGEAWQMPQGGIDEGEEPLAAAMREMEEEIGTAQAALLAESAGWYDYDLPEALIPKVWGGRFRGQRQKWFLLRFTGQDGDINLETPDPEFFRWKWVPAAQLPKLIVPFKKQLYADLVAEFADFLNRRV